MEKHITVLPERARRTTRLQHFVIELDPLRGRLAKFKYFRVVIADDRASQAFALIDLLPEKYDPFWKHLNDIENED
jgi:hypothetical protein